MGTITDPMLNEFARKLLQPRECSRGFRSKNSREATCEVDDAGAVGLAHCERSGSVARMLQQDSFDVSQGNFVPPQPKSMQEVLTAFSSKVSAMRSNACRA